MKKSILTLFLISFASLCAKKLPEISIEELEQAIQSNKVAILDVNGENSYKKGHIPGAIHYSSEKNNLKQLLPKQKDTLIVAYCGGPLCGAYMKGIKAASELGYHNLRHLSAGISGWKKAGKPISKP